MKKTIIWALGLLASHFAFGQAATIAVGTPLSIFEGQHVDAFTKLSQVSR
jgi:hypothetical protein